MTQIYVALAIVLAGFFGGWQVNGWRWEAKEKARVEQQLADQRASAATAIRRQDNVIAAQNAAADRMAGLRRDADAALAELERLRASLSGAGLRADPNALYTAPDPAAAVADLLTVSSKYVELAAQCDRHVNDIKTLMAAWPK